MAHPSVTACASTLLSTLGWTVLVLLPPLGETTEKGLYVDPSATFSQAYHPSSRGPFEKRAPMRSPVAGDGHGTPSPAPASLELQ